MNKFLNFEVLDGGIILNGLSYIRIFEIFPKNFVLEEEDLKNKFLLSFEQFLLSINSPLQIVAVNSQMRKKNILKYIKNITDEKLSNIYNKNISDFCNNKSLLLYTQRFFIILPIPRRRGSTVLKKEFLKIKKEIAVNDKQMEFLLKNIQVKYKILKNKKEVISLFKEFL